LGQHGACLVDELIHAFLNPAVVHGTSYSTRGLWLSKGMGWRRIFLRLCG
jgi:hypothetical protein